jgi:hypothetical protein
LLTLRGIAPEAYRTAVSPIEWPRTASGLTPIAVNKSNIAIWKKVIATEMISAGQLKFFARGDVLGG